MSYVYGILRLESFAVQLFLGSCIDRVGVLGNKRYNKIICAIKAIIYAMTATYLGEKVCGSSALINCTNWYRDAGTDGTRRLRRHDLPVLLVHGRRQSSRAVRSFCISGDVRVPLSSP